MMSQTGFLQKILPQEFLREKLTGLRPQAWLCVGAGFAREELKTYLLGSGVGFVGEAVTSVEEICVRVLGVQPEAVLTPFARQEILRMLLADRRIQARTPELKRLRRQRDFFKKLDRAVQSGRGAFAHHEEEQVISELLERRSGRSPVREEVRVVAIAYEAWLTGSGEAGLWDLPLLMKRACEALREGWPDHLNLPHEIVHLTAQVEEGLEKEFWETVSRHCSVRKVTPSSVSDAQPQADKPCSWERWHTLDDAVTSLAEKIRDAGSFEREVILIPDLPAVRRSVLAALSAQGIPLSDPRDPTRARREEAIKSALLPLEVVARNFDRQKVVSWLRSFPEEAGSGLSLANLVTEIHARGIRNGLKHYDGPPLERVHERLQELLRRLGGRLLVKELAERHLQWIGESFKDPSSHWVHGFFEQVWDGLIEDLRVVQNGPEKRAPLLFWLERLNARITEASPPVDKLKPVKGVTLHRLQQAPLLEPSRIWLVGLPASWLDGDSPGDYWLSQRERDSLSGEFSIRSAIQVGEERVAVLRAWLSMGAEAICLDAHYGYDGRERESILPALKELELASGRAFPSEPEEKGAHPRWLPSFGAQRSVPPLQVKLPPSQTREITATAIDAYSRCAFQALTFHRWKLRDIRDPDAELWPDVKGNILHEAVKVLLQSRDSDGNFSKSPQEALKLAWKKRYPWGLLKGEKLVKYAQGKLIPILESFCEKEREYVKRSGAQVLSLETMNLKLEYPGFTLVGTPDRVDENADGIFVLDYKTSSSLAHGTDMVNEGYRLQLPFYAIALKKESGKPVAGVQFVQLNRQASRSSGIYFKRYNGKETGKFTNVRSNSKSLLIEEPEEVWIKVEEQLVSHGKKFSEGHFEANPKKRDKECPSCPASDLCGYRRISDLSEGEPTSE